MNLNNNNNNNKSEKINLDQLMGKLKKEDAHYARLSRGLQIVYWVLIPIYTLLVIWQYLDSGDIYDLIGGSCYVIAFLILAVFCGKYHEEYKYADYALPTLKMLKNAVYRYQPIQLKSIWVLVAVLFADAGISINLLPDFTVAEVQIYFLGLMLISLIIGLITWHLKYKHLRDNALSIIAEIEGE